MNLTGRNVMVFIMESMSAEHSAYLMPEVYAGRETKGFTPFLDSLMRGGLCFKRMYANGTRSIQAMPSVLGSIPSFRTPFVLMPQSLGESRQLPAMLRDQGYSTAFFCGSEYGSMGFGAYARSAGVERLVSREDYEAKYGKGDFDGYWGIWDEPFLQFTGEELSQMPEPFFATLFTLSSHHRSSSRHNTKTNSRTDTRRYTRAWPTTTTPSGSSSSASEAKNGSAARSSYS